MGISHIADPYVLVPSRFIDYLLHLNTLVSLVTTLKRGYTGSRDFKSSPFEILPLDCLKVEGSNDIPILKLSEFADHNPIFHSQRETEIQNCRCKVYSCEVIEFWLSSKKYDACYQPFFPTWLISSLIICLRAKSLGFREIIDIGSGDARIPYCGAILGLRTISIELDSNLVNLQRRIINSTGVDFEIINRDACTTNFEELNLSRPMFLVSGLPEHGEVLAEAVINNLIQHEFMSPNFGFALMGSHTMKQYSRDRTLYGWGQFVAEHKLRILDCLTLPTMWTNEESIDTPFVFSMLR